MSREGALRRALRRREPAALATVLHGQLMAYRCSTIYAPSVTRLDAFVRERVLPRLREQLDVRCVVVERWERSRGPTLGQLVGEIHRQLGLVPGPGGDDDDAASPAGLAAALRRAERRSERPLLLVLYRLEELLDARRDPVEVTRFVDALAEIAERPTTGLHLVLGVHEEDLGAFRELLRGRWRLLANDIRIRPEGRRWLLPLPLVLLGFAAANPVAVTGAAGACAAVGLAAGRLASAPSCEEPARPEVAPAPAPELDVPADMLHDAPDPVPASTPSAGDTPPELDASSTGVGEPPVEASTTSPANTPAAAGPASSGDKADPDERPVPVVPARPGVCAASPRDGACAACVRSRCCAALTTCKAPQWRACVLKGPLGQEPCTPAGIEKSCRSLAICALENECRPDCFNH